MTPVVLLAFAWVAYRISWNIMAAMGQESMGWRLAAAAPLFALLVMTSLPR